MSKPLTRLCICRKQNESVRIGDATVTVKRYSQNRIQLVIEAPRDVPITRTELLSSPSSSSSN